jgi:geranylgeranyl pyrophosphate synthase/predicted secreted hydrolase
MSIDIRSDVRLQPADWPEPGPIDLAAHDLPHASSTVEWWYVNAHLAALDGRQFSLYAAFFRADNSEDEAPERSYQHFLIWGLVDPNRARYSSHTLLDPRSADQALLEMDRGRGPRDERLARALREVLSGGRIPLPDRLLKRDARVDLDRLALDYDGNLFVRRDEGPYELTLQSEDGGEGCRLRFTLEKPVVRHGDNGVVRGVDGEDMFYYFSPRCRVEGSILVDGERLDIAPGAGWYDHEFGERQERSSSDRGKVAWNWVAAQLDNGCEVSAYDLFDRDDPERSYGRWVIIVNPSGERRAHTDFSLTAVDRWTSTKTFNEYPGRYYLDVPGEGLHVEIVAALPAQEVVTLLAPPAFWEGRVDIHGMMNGVPVTGLGFVERNGVSVVDSTDDFLSSVGRETRRAIDALLPEHPTRVQALGLIGGERREHFLDGVDLDQYSRTVLKPIREILLRGGKAWRSYSVLACIDLVGGDSQPFAHWLALPELLHGGSLIIDDVQDQSDIRRGGPSCHKLFGEALAINSGCASYYLALIPLASSNLDASLRARVYESYFEAMRAAHAGQALDIDSLAGLMSEMVETGDGADLERRVLAIHRLKSAVPPGALARMATLIGGGTNEQAEGLGTLFEAYGLAFQIIDDVLNLRGFDDDRKSRGEDITHGKITAPIAKAMGRLSRPERQCLWSILAAKSADPERIRQAIAIIDESGALEACEIEARAVVEFAWRKVEPLVPDSQYKMRLRAFGWFVLDRHY